MEKELVPISNKIALTIEEAAEYSNIGQNKLSKLLKMPRCPFVLYVGKKKLVKRREFERFITESIEI
ncbi:MAG: helix-turn-helix domain-containing protein [Eubacterium sp.]|nr:helix-turn-helix domain-containing protein [Eubacterium sp.]